MTNNTFSWMPIYEELAEKLLGWRDKQVELIEILKTAKAEGNAVGNLEDEDEKGQRFPLKVIDPFTFFATFNRKIRDDFRIGILKVIKEEFGLESPLPTDFDGLPIMNPVKSWFFSYQPGREKDAISTLWDFASAIVTEKPESVPADLFERCLGIKQVGLANLTMGMFWMCPNSYIALDAVNRAYLKLKEIEVQVKDWNTYLKLREEIQKQFPNITWAEFSAKAYQEPVSHARYWLFQAKPERYDLVGSLRDQVLQNFQVNQHKKDIQPGDRVVIWQSGTDAGVYALATVTSKVGQIPVSEKEATYWKGEKAREPFTGVELTLDRVFLESPISKEILIKNKDLVGVPIGLQGTNFELTVQQFHAIEALAPKETEQRHYWMYAPGPNAVYWDEFFQSRLMALAWDDVGDLNSYANLTAIQQKLIKVYPKKADPKHDARALWDFLSVMQPGDIVIAKKGQSKYVGYGIVDGGYNYQAHRTHYKHIRHVDWLKQGEWSSGDYKIVPKALTNITDNPDLIAELQRLIGMEEHVARPPSNGDLLPSKNIILYGPPGTGKTYKLRTEYMELFTDRKAVLTPQERAAELARDLSWWEVVAIALLDAKGHRGKVKDILEHPVVEARLRFASNLKPANTLWVALQTHTKDDCPNVKYLNRIQPLIFWKDENAVWSVDEKLVNAELPDLVEKLNVFRKPPIASEERRRYRFTTFHQSFSYEDFIEGIKPQMENSEDGQLEYEIRKGVLREIVKEAIDHHPEPYALFIDEVNRGNVASIFGELITLIEDDKRLGEKNQLKATLPYSRDEFGVPSNLYIIGTMNTADRSVEALDTALRRRFTFREMRPLRSLVPQLPGLNIDLRRLFDVINSRIARLIDLDHCIGHAYFMEIEDINGLRRVFENKIIPLLREYFYGNPGKVGMVLGERFVSLLADKVPFALGAWGVDELDDKEVYLFTNVTELKEEDFASIYAEASAGI